MATQTYGTTPPRIGTKPIKKAQAVKPAKKPKKIASHGMIYQAMKK